MSTPADELRQAAQQMRERASAATPGPWWHEEDDLTWTLHGVAAHVTHGAGPDQVVNMQILKAPKKSREYAEYWPNDADTAHMVPLLNPAVALAVADWLDATASRYLELPSSVTVSALRVARAYLGTGKQVVA